MKNKTLVIISAIFVALVMTLFMIFLVVNVFSASETYLKVIAFVGWSVFLAGLSFLAGLLLILFL